MRDQVNDPGVDPRSAVQSFRIDPPEVGSARKSRVFDFRRYDLLRWRPRHWFVLLLVLVLGPVGYWAREEVDKELAFSAALRKVPVKALTGKPSVSQRSIDTAMAAFGIAKDPWVQGPHLDRILVDRGMTTSTSAFHDIHVTVGPSAFESWSMLASTLAHEMEVHTRQNILVISLLDAFGADGTGMAERQAYGHELVNAKRFGLNRAEREIILRTVVHYYPDQLSENGSRVGLAARSLRDWLTDRVIIERPLP